MQAHLNYTRGQVANRNKLRPTAICSHEAGSPRVSDFLIVYNNRSVACPRRPGQKEPWHPGAPRKIDSHVAKYGATLYINCPVIQPKFQLPCYSFCKLRQFISQPLLSTNITIPSALTAGPSQKSSINPRRNMSPQRFPKTSAFWRVTKIENELMGLPAADTTLPMNKLKSLGIERAPPLDIDNADAVDAYPVFFRPIPDTPEFEEAFAASRRDIYKWHRCNDERGDYGTLHCVSHLIGWLAGVAYRVAHVHHLYPADAPQWLRVS